MTVEAPERTEATRRAPAGNGARTSTCPRCLDGRHARCTDKASCACSICCVGVAFTRSPRTNRRTRRSQPDQRAVMVGVGRGNNPAGWRPRGLSSLPAPAQRIAEIMLTNGAGESEVARALQRSGACERATREQVRTIRLRMVGLTHRGARSAA